MIRKLDEENLTYAFPEVAFDNDYVIATYQAKVKTSNIEKLAMAIGSAREAVSRILNQFSREGCVSLSRGCIRILDKNALYSKLSLN